jgi:hypothetical protein
MIHIPETQPWQPPTSLEPLATLTDDYSGGILYELSTRPGRNLLRETLQPLDCPLARAVKDFLASCVEEPLPA